MKKVLYIGQYTEGTTSKMRADIIKKILDPTVFDIVDTHIPFFQTNRIFRSFGFRYKVGPLIKRTNVFIAQRIKNIKYDLIWVDKGVYIKKETTLMLRSKTDKLVHFTPDPAFTFHKSNHFNNSLKYYDFVITTKSFEKTQYESIIDKEKLLFATQGYDKSIHKPHHDFEEKKNGVVFIGHFEIYRASILQALIDNGIEVAVAGIKWNHFAKKNKEKNNFKYLGNSINGEDYAYTISKYMYSIGFLSKWIPELHTTRTFEIPACGTMLITEKNQETMRFFSDEEVIYYKTAADIIKQINFLNSNFEKLKLKREKALKKISQGEFDYRQIMERLLIHMNLHSK